MTDKLIIPMENVGQVSDGYHTFDELYMHRFSLFAALLHSYPHAAFKTRKSKDGSDNYDGWFIAGLNTTYGQISYHIPNRLWSSGLFNSVKEIEQNNDFDGHTSNDVLDRLLRICEFELTGEI